MDSNLLYSFIIQTLAIITGAFFGGEIIKSIYSPKVKVKAKNLNLREDKSGFFVSLNIINIGRSVASDCICHLLFDKDIDKDTLLEREDAMADECLPSYKEENNNFLIPRDQLTSPSSFRQPLQVQLCWTHHGNPCNINVNPGVTASIDICRFQLTENFQWYVLFPTERGWRRILFRMKIKPGTVLKGKLFICPSNDFPKILTFTLYLHQNKPKLLIGDKWMSKFKKINILKNS